MQECTESGLALKKQGPDSRWRVDIYNAVTLAGFGPEAVEDFAWKRAGSEQDLKVESLYLRSMFPRSAKRRKQVCRAPRDKCGT